MAKQKTNAKKIKKTTDSQHIARCEEPIYECARCLRITLEREERQRIEEEQVCYERQMAYDRAVAQAALTAEFERSVED